jgi:hypothetical protein
MFKVSRFLTILAFISNTVFASTILETATYGLTRGGLAIGDQYIGARFSLSETH